MKSTSFEKIQTGIPAIDHVLDGGICRGSLILLSAPPGQGKTTLAMQIAAGTKCHTLFRSYNQSTSELLHQANRLGICDEKLRLSGCDHEEKKPQRNEVDLMIVDDARRLHDAERFVERLKDSVRDSNIAALVLAPVNSDLLSIQQIAYEADVELLLWGFDERQDRKRLSRNLRRQFRDGQIDSEHVRTLYCAKNRSGAAPRYAFLQMMASGFVSLDNTSDETGA